MSHRMEADSIQLSFGQRRILSDIYIRCDTGMITGLLGRNGEGKSCLMNIMYGSMAAENSSVRFNGVYERCPLNKPELLAYLPQFRFIPKKLRLRTVFEHFGLSFRKFTSFFSEFDPLYRERIGLLSSGQARLVEVYVIINAASRFVMLDEPFSYIMPLHVQTLAALLREQKKEKGFLISDHLYRHITDIADSVYVLKDGKTHLIASLSDIERLGYARLSRD